MLTVALILTANAQSLKDYTGHYEFFEDGGKTAGDTAVFVGHGLKIEPDGAVKLNADGFQTARDLIGTARIEGGKLKIYFTLYNDEGINSFTPYEAEDLLLILEFKTVSGKKVLWTTFGKYQPAIISAETGGGIYFKATKK